MVWKTIVEVANVLPDDATITLAETAAAVGTARAICSLAQSGRICFDLDGNLIEDWNKSGTRKGIRLKKCNEGRRKRRPQNEEKEAGMKSLLLSPSGLADIW